MSTALATLEPQSLAEAEQFARRLSESSLMPQSLRGKPADVLVVMLTGRELGVSPLTALRSIHVVQGRPVLDAALIVAMVKRSPACLYFQLVESNDQRATYETQRRGDPKPTSMTYTYEQAQRAGLTSKDNWKHHTAAMLRARASSALARAVYPDLVLNVLTEDEAEEIQAREPRGSVTVEESPATPKPAPDVTDAEIVEPAPEYSDEDAISFWRDQFEQATTLDALNEVSKMLRQSKPSKAVRDALAPIYSERKAALSSAEPHA